MKAAIYYDQQDVRLVRRPDPVCGPDGAALKTLVSSICGTASDPDHALNVTIRFQ